ncbi:MAG: sugar ABC transporter ATP-binding protein [Lachnospiraceae bacterium]|nr:sugar ABC transporter ATP-binding protein [Lachnospiraceae bacterium]
MDEEIDVKTVLRTENITKTFSGVTVLKDVSFELLQGETHILIGENGAGKSTLMKILLGVYHADSGKVFLPDESGNLIETEIPNPKIAMEKGISMVFQEFNLMDNMNIAENIFIGREFVNKGVLDKKRMHSEAKKWIEQVKLDVPTDTLVGNLTTAEKQCVEIAKCLSQNAKIIVLDEPTSSLSDKEVRTLFVLIEELKKRGISIIYISHRMEEIFEIGDRVTVLRDGQYVGTERIADIDEKQLVKMMIGREFNYDEITNVEKNNQEIVFELKGITTEKSTEPLDFYARKGEIVGVFGLVGAGRTEMARVMFGIDKSPTGEIFKNGKKISINSAKDAIDNGIGMVPEDRKQLGLITKHNIQNNMTIVKLRELPKILLKDNREASIADEYIKALSIACKGKKQLVERLSGGNQQKVVIAKWMSLDLDVLILDEPTRGVDVKAKSEIYDIMRNLAAKGKTIIMISSDLPEILRVSHRVVVIHDGRVTMDHEIEGLDQEIIMNAALS